MGGIHGEKIHCVPRAADAQVRNDATKAFAPFDAPSALLIRLRRASERPVALLQLSPHARDPDGCRIERENRGLLNEITNPVSTR
jgi:hypothetical protein